MYLPVIVAYRPKEQWIQKRTSSIVHIKGLGVQRRIVYKDPSSLPVALLPDIWRLFDARQISPNT